MKSLRASWPSVEKRIASEKKKLLLLDFDGTLASIAKNPKAVVVRPEIRRLLKILSRRSDFIVAVISGRSMKDVRSHLRVSNVVYVGNHGLEICGRGLHLPSGIGTGRPNTAVVNHLADVFRGVFYFWPGILVENKVHTLSLHFRNLRPDRKAVFDEVVAFYRRKFKNFPIVWRKGRKVWEIRPFPGWGKGDAVRHLSEKYAKALPIAIGDDDTDEDMFETLRSRGISIRVGRSKRSLARFYVDSPKEVAVLLERLAML